MGTSRSALELAMKFDQLSREVEKRQRLAERAAAVPINRAVTRNLRAATGGDMRLSGMGRKARPMRVATRSVTSGTLVKVNGPAQLVENDVDKHYVVSKYAEGAARISATTGRRLRATRRSRVASVAFGAGAAGGGRRAVLNLGGGRYLRWTVAYSKGRHPWRDGVRASRSKAVQAMRAEEAKAVVRVFR